MKAQNCSASRLSADNPLKRESLQELPDAELAQMTKEANEQAYIAIVDRYKGKLLKVIGKILRDKDEVEDVLQEVLTIIWKNFGKYEERGCLHSWLFRIAANQAINRYRVLQNRPPMLLIEEEAEILPPSSFASPEELVTFPSIADLNETDFLGAIKESNPELFTALLQLPPDFLQVLLSVGLFDLSYKEAAERLGIPKGTVMSRLFRARLQIAQLLGKESPVKKRKRKEGDGSK